MQDAMESIKGNFKGLALVAGDKILVMTKFPTFGDEKIQVSPETWSDLAVNLREIWVEVEKEPQQQLPPILESIQVVTNKNNNAPPVLDPSAQQRKLTVHLCGYTGNKYEIFCMSLQPIDNSGDALGFSLVPKGSVRTV